MRHSWFSSCTTSSMSVKHTSLVSSTKQPLERTSHSSTSCWMKLWTTGIPSSLMQIFWSSTSPKERLPKKRQILRSSSRLQFKQQGQFHGELRESNTDSTSYSLISLRTSTCSFLIGEQSWSLTSSDRLSWSRNCQVCPSASLESMISCCLGSRLAHQPKMPKSSKREFRLMILSFISVLDLVDSTGIDPLLSFLQMVFSKSCRIVLVKTLTCLSRSPQSSKNTLMMAVLNSRLRSGQSSRLQTMLTTSW